MLQLPETDLSSWKDMAIGTDGEPFTGHFSGYGSVLRYRVTAEAEQRGLFPSLSGAVVRDLKLYVEQDAAGGALVQRAQNSRLENVSLAVAITGTATGAGLVAETDADTVVSGCTVSAAAESYENYGGITGVNGGLITDCRFLTAQSASGANFGGIVQVNDGKIEDCSAEVSAITGDGESVGGLAGSMSGGSIVDSRVGEGNLYGKADVGGLVGKITAEKAVAISNCIASPSVAGTERIGGLIGSLSGTAGIEVQECRAIGASVTATGSNAGGLAGSIAAGTKINVSHCTAVPRINSAGNSGGMCGSILSAQASFTDCHAFGNIESGVLGGGFTGTGAGVFTNCTVSGSVVKCTSNNAGFVAQTCDDLAITRCRVYGEVSGISGASGATAGFITGDAKGHVIKVSDCEMYGNCTDGYSLAGIVSRADSGTVQILRCTVYGNVRNTTGTVGSGTADTGGIFGYTTGGCKVTITDCRVYGKVSGVKGNINGISPTSSANCVYSPGGAPDAAASCAITAEGTVTRLAFTFHLEQGWKVDSIALSLDGGRYYTQLAYDGKALLGGVLTDGTDFSVTYPGSGNARVKLVLTNGTQTVTDFFT